MKVVASLVLALAAVASLVPAASASDCSRVLHEKGTAAYFACLEQEHE